MSALAQSLPPLDAIEALPLPVFTLNRTYQLAPLNNAATTLLEAGRVFTRTQLSPTDAQGRLLCPLADEAFARGEVVYRADVVWPNDLRSLSLWLAPYGEQLLCVFDLSGSDEPRSAASDSAALMAAQLAHEIRNPLLAITGAAQLLAQSGAQGAMCELILREGARIERLLKEMDPLRGAREAARVEVNIHEILDQAVASVEAGISPHIKVTRSFDPSLPTISGDPDTLSRAFTNLIKNAAEACLGVAQPEITLSTRYQQGGAIAVDIADNGPGIADAMAAQLFRPFVTSKPDGRGLGLSIVARIIEDHGGEVSLTSRKRGATSFRVLLPTR